MLNRKKSIRRNARGQAMSEFGLALPILMFVLVGLLEVGRAVYMYAAVTNASREAVRYATAYGVNEKDVLNYQNCDAIRAVARRVGFLLPLSDSDIVIEYDSGPQLVDPDGIAGTGDEYFSPPPSPPDKGKCSGSVDSSIHLQCGDRVKVTVKVNYKPMLAIVPMQARKFSAESARTFTGVIELTKNPEECE